MEYDEIDFVAYSFEKMGLKVLLQNKNVFELENNFSVEVEKKDLYRLSVEGFVISPFDDIGDLIEFIKKNNG